ncbi:MAG: SH3 domain-containing protein [Synergistaceae bacterium]|nr:SH3 domain-containing protein [Synergistaceae bacterium]
MLNVKNIKSIMLTAALAAILTGASAALAVSFEPEDIARFPQEGSAYLPTEDTVPIADYVNQVVYAEEYLRNHFAPWRNGDLSFLDLTFEKILKLHNSIAGRQYYADGKNAFPRKSMEAIAKNGVIDVNATPRPGIAILPADVRVLPYGKPLYASASAAQGANGRLKLDVLQNSTVKPGEPLAIFCASGDSNWLFIATGTVVGWVASAAAAPVDLDFMDIFTYSAKSVVVKDNARVTDGAGKFMYNLKLGTVLPSEDGALLLPVRGKNGMASVTRFKPETEIAETFPVAFTPRNAAKAIDEMMGEPYGWGGASGFRDCSAMTRDYFGLFGVWLPRNSADQAVTGVRISLKNTPSSEKNSVIVPSAVPFATLMHMPGHIMLYLGVYNGEPVAFHNTWGVRTNSGRAVVGRAAVTSLKLGSEIKDRPADSLLIDRMDSFSFPMADLRQAQE